MAVLELELGAAYGEVGDGEEMVEDDAEVLL